MARLILINGLPGLGKSSLALEYVRRHPLALVVDIDDLRTRLGRWESRPESKELARDLAAALASAHLAAGHDVVVPQFVGRPGLGERLEQVAAEVGARFIEVVLTGDRSVAVDRFLHRRIGLEAAGHPHPQADIADQDVEAMMAAAADLLDRRCADNPTIRPVPADTAGGPEATWAAFRATLDQLHDQSG